MGEHLTANCPTLICKRCNEPGHSKKDCPAIENIWSRLDLEEPPTHYEIVWHNIETDQITLGSNALHPLETIPFDDLRFNFEGDGKNGREFDQLVPSIVSQSPSSTNNERDSNESNLIETKQKCSPEPNISIELANDQTINIAISHDKLKASNSAMVGPQGSSGPSNSNLNLGVQVAKKGDADLSSNSLSAAKINESVIASKEYKSTVEHNVHVHETNKYSNNEHNFLSENQPQPLCRSRHHRQLYEIFATNSGTRPIKAKTSWKVKHTIRVKAEDFIEMPNYARKLVKIIPIYRLPEGIRLISKIAPLLNGNEFFISFWADNKSNGITYNEIVRRIRIRFFCSLACL